MKILKYKGGKPLEIYQCTRNDFRNRKKKSGFTLIEMLIVIVIIWILAAAIVPKITRVIARAKDTKRVTDLRNVATAIEMYKADYGNFPLPKSTQWYYNYVCSLDELKESIWNYLNIIPKDPKKSSSIDVWTDRYDNRRWMKYYMKNKKWEYIYQLWLYGNSFIEENIWRWDFALLIAKVKTPSFANYLMIDHEKTKCLWCGFWIVNRREAGKDSPEHFPREQLQFCDIIKKVDEWEQKMIVKNWKVECQYSSEDQLYYIMKIEWKK